MRAVTQREVGTIKFLIKKGLSMEEICSVTNRSKSTIKRVKEGKFDVKTPDILPELRSLITSVLDTLAEIEEKLDSIERKD